MYRTIQRNILRVRLGSNRAMKAEWYNIRRNKNIRMCQRKKVNYKRIRRLISKLSNLFNRNK